MSAASKSFILCLLSNASRDARPLASIRRPWSPHGHDPARTAALSIHDETANGIGAPATRTPAHERETSGGEPHDTSFLVSPGSFGLTDPNAAGPKSATPPPSSDQERRSRVSSFMQNSTAAGRGRRLAGDTTPVPQRPCADRGDRPRLDLDRNTIPTCGPQPRRA